MIQFLPYAQVHKENVVQAGSDETPIYLAYIEPLSPPAKHLTHTQTIKPQPH